MAPTLSQSQVSYLVGSASKSRHPNPLNFLPSLTTGDLVRERRVNLLELGIGVVVPVDDDERSADWQFESADRP
ncbi:hypothetical protein D9619_008404 [Psilocybe cf. subviscida]|uniref:Uncharacterized protein n=1 Tax=Psilocybe cf. subviscida TaxID=2480587 RepID=A0A8H5BA60_9AGAR|nr:hypothetical protein D9619_008404 [Psilocybe cf. subviscida]